MLVVLFVLALLALPVAAQEVEDDRYTFESGASFTVPSIGVLDLERNVPRVVVSQIENGDGDIFVILDFYDPAFLSNLFGADTAELSLEDALNGLVIALDREMPPAEEVVSSNTSDGRQGVTVIFTSDVDGVEIANAYLITRFDNGQIGIIGATTSAVLTDPVVEVILNAVDSFNAPGALLTFEGDLYDFEHGAFVTVPPGWVLDTSGFVPNVSLQEPFVIVDIYEPFLMDERLADTSRLELTTVLRYMLDLINYPDDVQEGDLLALEATLDNRDILLFDFLNPNFDFLPETMLIVRMSDGTAGVIHAQPDEELDDDTFTMLFTLADSFDVPTDGTSAPARASLPNYYEYPSGAFFRYPDEFTVNEEAEAPFTALVLPGQAVIVMLDPVLLGLDPDITLVELIELSLEDLPMTPDDLAQFNIGGRTITAATGEGEVDGEPRVFTMIYVPFDNGSIGVIEILSLDFLRGDLFDVVLEIAGSFNSTTFLSD
ncbi:MAG: hypothetical protein EA396_14115 [Anaerolineaceae bacterium]|nr:MAG: hypothetical protein EA396_14115 [Anaerolineaceae bacterium]